MAYEAITEGIDGYTIKELRDAFEAAHADPETVYPVKYDWATWKSPFIAIRVRSPEEMPGDFTARVEVLVSAIKFFDADSPEVTYLNKDTAVIVTKGYQAW